MTFQKAAGLKLFANCGVDGEFCSSQTYPQAGWSEANHFRSTEVKVVADKSRMTVKAGRQAMCKPTRLRIANCMIGFVSREFLKDCRACFMGFSEKAATGMRQAGEQAALMDITQKLWQTAEDALRNQALRDFFDIDYRLVAGISSLLLLGRFYSYSADHRHCSGFRAMNSGKECPTQKSTTKTTILL